MAQVEARLGKPAPEDESIGASLLKLKVSKSPWGRLASPLNQRSPPPLPFGSRALPNGTPHLRARGTGGQAATSMPV